MHDLLKKKICKENKKQKDQNALNMIASVYSRRCESLGCISEVIVPIKQL